MGLKVIIADYEPAARKELRKLVEREPGLEIQAECATASETLAALKRTVPDIALLNVHLPGVDESNFLVKVASAPALILMSLDARLAAQAFDLEATDFLLLPLKPDRARLALARARARLRWRQQSDGHASEGAGRSFPIRSQGRVALVPFADIKWIQAADNYVELHTKSGTHMIRNTIRGILAQLEAGAFAQISRSHIVNLGQITEIRSRTHGDFTLLLENGTRVNGTRNFRRNIPGLR